MIQLSRTRNGYRTLAAALEEAEGDLFHGLRNIHQLAVSTAAVTGALSCGAGDRMENERTYLDLVLVIVESISMRRCKSVRDRCRVG